MGCCPIHKTYMKACFLNRLFNQELGLDPHSRVRYLLSNTPFSFDIMLFYKHCSYLSVYLTTFLIFSSHQYVKNILV